MSDKQQSRPLGERMIASPWRVLLFPLWIVYRPIVRIRNWLYDQGLLHQHRLPIPVISIGNIIAGGSGKTPMVAYLIEQLHAHGQCAVLSRGYKGDGERNEESDLVDAPVFCNSKRIVAGKRALEAGAQIALLDDGFQHRALARDLDIVLIDATRPWGTPLSLRGTTLPLGFLRESADSLKRADVIILTRCDQVNAEWIAAIKKQCARFQKPILECTHQASHFSNLDQERIELDQPQIESAYCISGIAHPAAFIKTVQQLGINVAGQHDFDDHHHYNATEVAQICERASKLKLPVLCTTKDSVKLQPLWPRDENAPELLTLHVHMVMSLEDQESLSALTKTAVTNKRQP